MKTMLFLIAACLYAEDAAAPEISSEQQADYFQAQVEQLQADAHLKAAIDSMQKTCGQREIILSDKRKPICKK